MSSDEAIIEFYSIGNAVKVSAVDMNTGLEVSIMGDVSESKERLTQVVMQKLHYMLNKRASEDTSQG